MKIWLQSLRLDERGVTAIEYALLAALIAAVIAGAVSTLGSQVAQLYDAVKDQLSLAIQ
jgi:pilus assembly protein Flp/PilA